MKQLVTNLKNYRKETPTKISCYRKINDSSDSSDSNRKDPFDSFFPFEPSLEIIKEEVDKTNTGVNLVEQEKLHYENEETNNKGSSFAVTAVTNENQSYNQFVSNQEMVYKKQEQNIAAEFIEKDIINSCSTYRYTPQQIEEFFASDNGQV